MTNTNPWLTIVGLGEDGLAGLSQAAHQAIHDAEIVVGGARHLAHLPAHDRREHLTWPSPLEDLIPIIIQQRGKRVCVLASGDPLWYGVGTTFARHILPHEMRILPAPSAFSLACSRLIWSLEDIITLNLRHHLLARLARWLRPGNRIIALSEGPDTPALVASLLCEHGFGCSRLIIFENMGSPHERRREAHADNFNVSDISPLNTLAIECRSEADVNIPTCTLGLADELFEHDGKLTKCELRTITLAALAPMPGGCLWDIGSGSGAIAIEWMRAVQGAHAIAIEPCHAARKRIARNALALGVPDLTILSQRAPESLSGLPPPHAIFIGGGLSEDNLIETSIIALQAGGGRIVANAVTLESEQRLLIAHRHWGGELLRIAIQKAKPIGRFHGWNAAMPITQWRLIIKRSP